MHPTWQELFFGERVPIFRQVEEYKLKNIGVALNQHYVDWERTTDRKMACDVDRETTKTGVFPLSMLIQCYTFITVTMYRGLQMLTQKRRAALTALLQTNNKAKAARLAGVSERTIRNYWNDSEFQKEYGDACRQLLRDAARRAQVGIMPTVTALLHIVQDEGETATARVSAARVLIDATVKLSEVTDMNDRIKALEEGTQDAERME